MISRSALNVPPMCISFRVSDLFAVNLGWEMSTASIERVSIHQWQLVHHLNADCRTPTIRATTISRELNAAPFAAASATTPTGAPREGYPSRSPSFRRTSRRFAPDASHGGHPKSRLDLRTRSLQPTRPFLRYERVG